MKHLYSYIVYLFLLFNILPAYAEKVSFPDDFTGSTTLSQIAKYEEGEDMSMTLEQFLNIAYEVGSYLYERYSAEDILSENFINEIKKFFPEDSEDDLEEKLETLRIIADIYSRVKSMYNEYLEKKLIPHTYKTVKSENDYDHPGEVGYIESEPGYFAKVYNFKKFLTYSDNEDERRAIVEFERSKEDPNNIREKIVSIVKNSDWKKLIFYGSVYENPLASNEGISEEYTEGDVKAQLLSRNSYIRGNKEIDFGIRLSTAPYTFIVANNISEQIHKPEIDLSGSNNVENAEITYPVPLNAGNHFFVHKYFGEFMIPIKVTVKDVEQPIDINAKVKVFSCDNNLDCQPVEFNLHLEMQPTGTEVFSNGYDNYFNINLAKLPSATSPYIKLDKFIVDYDNDNTQVLRLEFTSRKSVENFKVFVEAEDDIILFDAPLISLHDNKIYVRYLLHQGQDNVDLLDKPFVISAVLNNRYFYRTHKTVSKVSEFDTQSMKINLGLLFLAVLGGLFLNFMPCVFPVISLKMMTFAKTKKRQRRQLKRDLSLTIAGIFCGFTLLIIMLWIAKYMGYSLGWGMQFQNMGFLVVMTFIVISVIIALPVLNFESMQLPDLGKYSGFIVGNLAVLLATPCTGPYLATAVGFALAGSYSDILLMLYGIALGLSVPYLMILGLKEPESFFPKPGKWMIRLELFMRLMLLLTLLWFVVLIFEQTDLIFVIKFIFIIGVFAAIIKLCKMFLDYLDGIFDENISEAVLLKIRRGCYIFMFLVFVIFCGICTIMAQKSYTKNYMANMQGRLTFVDTNLIDDYLKQGHPVLVEISADWCLTCHVNKLLVFNKTNMDNWKNQYNLEFIRVDWTNYNRDILDYMERYGRKGLPFYILYTPFIREGMVLPETFQRSDLAQILSVSHMR